MKYGRPQRRPLLRSPAACVLLLMLLLCTPPALGAQFEPSSAPARPVRWRQPQEQEQDLLSSLTSDQHLVERMGHQQTTLLDGVDMQATVFKRGILPPANEQFDLEEAKIMARLVSASYCGGNSVQVLQVTKEQGWSGGIAVQIKERPLS